MTSLPSRQLTAACIAACLFTMSLVTYPCSLLTNSQVAVRLQPAVNISYVGALLAQRQDPSIAIPVSMTAVSAYTTISDTTCWHCAVLSLGRIEYLHPGFHDVKNFWPVGYKVGRLAATPASGKKECLHTCEILERPDGSGPLFRSAQLLLPLLLLLILLCSCCHCCCCSSRSKQESRHNSRSTSGVEESFLSAAAAAAPPVAGSYHCCFWLLLLLLFAAAVCPSN